MIYWNPLYDVNLSADQIVFSDERGEFRLYRPTKLHNWGLLRSFKLGVSLQQIEKTNGIERSLIKMLFSKKLIASFPSQLHPSDADRNAGHLLAFTTDPMAALDRVRSSTVCVLGVGGIGTVVLQHLVAVGVRSYVLVDHDCVETENLNRQFIFSLSDVGRLKVQAAKDFILSRVQDAHILALPIRIESAASMKQLPVKYCDIIVHCLDTPTGVIDGIAYEFGRECGIPVINAAVGLRYGHWGPLISTRNNGCSYEDWRKAYSDTRRSSSFATGHPMRWSFGPTNTLVAANLALDVVEWLAGRTNVRSLNTRFVHEFATCNTTSYRTPGPVPTRG